MARVTNPLLSTSATGSIGGTQYSRNRSGAFVSRKSTGTYSQKPGPIALRALFARASHAWRDQPPDVHAGWDHIAPYPHTGRQLYIGCAIRLMKNGFPPPIESPVVPYPSGTCTNFALAPGDLPPHYPELNWDYTPSLSDYLSMAWSTTSSYATPHVRKFKWNFRLKCSAPPAYLPNLPAHGITHVTLTQFHPALGLSLGVWTIIWDPAIW